MAAFIGIPAIAISGLDDDDAEMVTAVNDFVSRLIKSPIIKNMSLGEYFTVSIPRVKAQDIKGVRMTSRMQSYDVLEDGSFIGPTTYVTSRGEHLVVDFEFEEVEGSTEKNRAIWKVGMKLSETKSVMDTDVSFYDEGYIVIVPMRVNEDNPVYLDKSSFELPSWR